MSNLKAKLKNSKGFTLIEMLIVVAIIAILIAIAIPMINRALEAAREATDEANMRAAIGIAMADVMMGTEDNGDNPGDGVLTSDFTSAQTAYYVIGTVTGSGSSKNGYLSKTAPSTGYGKGTTLGADPKSHAGGHIIITVAANTGLVTADWSVGPNTGGGGGT